MSGRRRYANQSGGRIHPSQREADDTTPILGADVQNLGENFDENYNKTLDLGLDNLTRKDYRRRLKRIICYWEEHCPEYFEVGVRNIGAAERANARKYFFNRYDKDVIYSGLNVKFIISFMMATERHDDGKLKSFRHSKVQGCHFVGRINDR